MKTRIYLILSLIALFMNACGDNELGIIRVWIEPNNAMGQAEAVELCNQWNAVDVFCVAATSPDNAVVYVTAVADSGADWLGLSLHDGDRTVMLNIAYDHQMISQGLVHEIGHVLGMHHTQKDCSKSHYTYCEQPICGAAIMNDDRELWGTASIGDRDILYYAYTQGWDCSKTNYKMQEYVQ